MLTRASIVAVLLVAVVALAGCGGGGSGVTTDSPAHYLNFHSRPELSPPKLFVTHADQDPSAGPVFLAPKGGRQSMVEIADGAGDPVWMHRVEFGGATDFTVQQLDGQPVLTWWEGSSLVGYGAGSWQVYDTRYQRVATIRAGNGLAADEHELQIEPDGTAFVDAYHTVAMDLSSVGGPKRGYVEDGIVQRVDVTTGKVLWQWSALAHVALDRSYSPVKGQGTAKVPYDYFHVNFIDLEPSGKVLISSRNTHALYEVEPSTGAVDLVVGGKRPTYAMGPGTQFAWQHDARRQPDGDITVFDDAASPATESYSRALTLHVDDQAKTVTLVHADVSPEHLLSASQGDAQLLPDGNTLVGYGSRPYVEEFDPSGKVLLDLHFAATGDNYRAFRFPWSGDPQTVPAIAVSNDGATVWASWNGATAVTSWRLVGGAAVAHLRTLMTTPRIGFETTIHAPAEPFLAVQALNASGHVLATSRPVATISSPQ